MGANRAIFSYIVATSGAIYGIDHLFHRFCSLIHCQVDGNISEIGHDAELMIID
jgi:hypothetical protein